jgi:voltage-gated potassium channel
VVVVLGFSALLVVGTAGYAWLEGWHWADALYMTVITLSTVGYGEVRPLSVEGRAFSMVMILLGVGGFAYSFSLVADYIVAGELGGALRRQRMLHAINKLRDHYIICGYGRVGREVVEGLRANKFGIVVIDAEEENREELEAKGIRYVAGDATDDEVLVQAGIARASGLCTCLPNDAANVFVTLSARTLNPKLYIISRGNQAESERKLRMAGADRVINPYLITGHRMAAQLLHPGAVEFLEVIMRQGELELRIEEIVIAAGSDMAGRTLGELHVRRETGVNVLAVRRAEDRLYTNLDANFQLQVADALVCLGTAAQLTALANKAGDRRTLLAATDTA